MKKRGESGVTDLKHPLVNPPNRLQLPIPPLSPRHIPPLIIFSFLVRSQIWGRGDVDVWDLEIIAVFILFF